MDVQSLSEMERHMQEYFVLSLGSVHDMCEKMSVEAERSVVDLEYYDEQTRKRLGSKPADMGGRAELDRIKTMGVYAYAPRSIANTEPTWKTVKAKWVRIIKGSDEKPEARCRLVAQEL